MPSDFERYAAKYQDEMLKAVKRAQETNLAALQQARELFSEAANIEKLPTLDNLPTPAKVVELSCDYATKLLELQKQYALSIAEVFSSVQKDATQATVRAAQAASNNAQRATVNN